MHAVQLRSSKTFQFQKFLAIFFMSTMKGDDVQSDLHQYLEQNNIHTLVVSILEDLLMKQPKQPICFIVDHLLVSQYLPAHGDF